MTVTNCPPEATLRLIGTEAIGEATFAGLEGHVEHCPDCQRILEAAMNAVPHVSQVTPALNAPPPPPGLVIERELGRGGASVVYLAWEPALKRHVAVKLFSANSLVDPHSREHWLSEARALSRVPHDQVVAIHRVDETEEWLWLVLEYVAGGTLKDRLTEPLPSRDAARLMETIACAVGYFHTRGVCHLDLKPSNILLDAEPGALWEIVSPKISDFGIARLDGEPGTTETGANGPKGTPSYMAPEQVAALRGTIGPAADIHALGALLYHLLTGRPPFQGASSAETLDQVRSQEPVPPRRLNSRIPRDLETICLTCLEKAPSRRYRTAEALAGDLRVWLEGRPITARRVSPLGHAWRLCRRHPAVAMLVVTLAMTVSTGLVGLSVLLEQADAERARLAVARRNAEAYAQFSATAADQLAGYLRTALGHRMGAASVQMEKEALLKLRSATNLLKGNGVVPSSALGILELEIGCALMLRSKADEARDHLNQAVADLKLGLAKKPEDKEARIWILQSLFLSGVSDYGAGQLEDAFKCFEQAAAVQVEIEPSDCNRPTPTELYKRVQLLADRLEQRADNEREKRSRDIGQKLLRYLLGSSPADATNAYPPGLETLGRLFRRHDLKKMFSHGGNESRSEHERFVAEWLAMSIGPLSPFGSSSNAAVYDRDPESGASTLISAIRDRCSKLGLVDSMVPATIRVVTNSAQEAASEQRRQVGRLDEARATAGRLIVLARRLVLEYPNNAVSYFVLSQAHDQIKKNAVRVREYDLVEQALVHAIGAAQRSLALDPDVLLTRGHLDKLTDQLANLKAERNAARSAIAQ